MKYNLSEKRIPPKQFWWNPGDGEWFERPGPLDPMDFDPMDPPPGDNHWDWEIKPNGIPRGKWYDTDTRYNGPERFGPQRPNPSNPPSWWRGTAAGWLRYAHWLIRGVALIPLFINQSCGGDCRDGVVPGTGWKWINDGEFLRYYMPDGNGGYVEASDEDVHLFFNLPGFPSGWYLGRDSHGDPCIYKPDGTVATYEEINDIQNKHPTPVEPPVNTKPTGPVANEPIELTALEGYDQMSMNRLTENNKSINFKSLLEAIKANKAKKKLAMRNYTSPARLPDSPLGGDKNAGNAVGRSRIINQAKSTWQRDFNTRSAQRKATDAAFTAMGEPASIDLYAKSMKLIAAKKRSAQQSGLEFNAQHAGQDLMRTVTSRIK